MNVLIVGNFGYRNNIIGGQTIKTRSLLHLFKEKFSDGAVNYFDIDDLYVNKIKLFYLIKSVISSPIIILVPGQKFLKIIFPIVVLLCKVLNKRLLFFAVGGWLCEFLEKNKLTLKLIKNSDKIFVESLHLKILLEETLYLNNIVTFPNFRYHDSTYRSINNEFFRIVFMARVTETKGVNTLFQLMNWINNNPKQFNKKVILNIYGPIDKNFENTFNNNLSQSDNVFYKGVVSPECVYKELSENDICILPTFHEGEGFPGTIVDSYIAGVPVIVSRWKNLPEFIEHEKTGFIYNLNQFNDLVDIVKRCVNNQVLLTFLKDNALIKAKEYSSDKAWSIIEYHLEKLKH